MEASERPQLPLDEGGDGVVRALDDRLVIESLTVDDERAARLVRERAQAGKPATETVKKTIEIGSRILDNEETAANVDYVRRELRSGLGDLDQRLTTTLEAGAESLVEQISTVFGAERNDSVQAQIKEIVTAAGSAQREQLLQTLTAEDGTNPLVAMQVRIGKKLLETEERHRQEVELLRESHGKESRAMQSQVHDLKEHIARLLDKQDHELELAEAEDAGTRKGLSFEDGVHEAVERLASARGDAAHHTGGEASEGGGRKGDTVIEVGAANGPCRARVVFEAKDKRNLSKQEAWRQLNGALEERSADFAVLVVAGDDQIPSGREPLHEYEGNKLIVAVDREEPDGLALEIAYRLALARVTMLRDRSLTVDAAAVKDEAEAAIAALKEAQKVRRAMSGAETSIDNARQGLNAMVDLVRAHLERIDGLVEDAQAETE